MVNQTKIYQVDELTKDLKETKSAALVDYQGLSAPQINELRTKIRESGGQMFVIKNTLIALALANLGIDLENPLTGPTAVILSNKDEVTTLKIVKEAAKNWDKPEFKLGVYQEKLLSLEKLKALIDLPGKEVLLSKVVNGLAAPLYKLAYGLKFNQTKLVMVLKQVREKKGGEA